MFTILIVDDDSFTRRSLKRTLSDSDMRILEAPDSARALEILATEDVRVVISDYHMGAVDGASFLSEVERRHPQVVRFLLTSDTATDVMVAAVNDGRARRVLYKPWHDEQIRAVVRRCIGAPRKPAAPPKTAYTLRPMGPRTVSRLAAILGVEISKE